MSKSNDLEYDNILNKIDLICSSKLEFTQTLSSYKSQSMASDLDLRQSVMDYIFGETEESPFDDINKDHQKKMDDYDDSIDFLTSKAIYKQQGKIINK